MPPHKPIVALLSRGRRSGRFQQAFGLGVLAFGMLLAPQALQAQLPPSMPAPFPLEDTFLLHSFPGGTKTIYLDFDGFTSPTNEVYPPYNDYKVSAGDREIPVVVLEVQ